MFSKSAGSKLDRTVPVRGFIIAAAILFVIMWLHSRGFSTDDGSYGETGVYFDTALATQPGRMANIFVHYLVYVTTSYGTMLFFFRKTSEAPQVPQKRPKFGDILIGAIAVVSTYGKVLEEQSRLYGVAIPVSRLPCPKAHIKTAIQIVYNSIRKEVAREIIKERLP
jgi:hypothetical protein